MDFEHELFNMEKWIIMAAGAWNLEIKGYIRLPYTIYAWFFRFIYFCCTVFVFTNLFVNIGIDNEKAVESISMAAINICCTIKVLIAMNNNVTKLLQVVMEDDTKIAVDNREIKKMLQGYKKYIRCINIFIVTYTYAMIIGLTVFGGFLDHNEYKKIHANVTEDRESMLGMWLPIDVEKHFYLAIATQTVLMLITCPINYSTVVLYNVLMTYAIIKLRILQLYFKNFDKYGSESENNILSDQRAINNLKNIIKQHQDLIRFVKELDHSIRYGLLIEYTISSLLLASVLVQIVNGNKIEVFVPYGLILTFQLFLLSWNSDEIRTQSGNIAFAVYESNWYAYGSEVRRMIYFVMMRSRKELSLNIGPFGPNNMNAAVARMKLAYSYVSVMSGNGEKTN